MCVCVCVCVCVYKHLLNHSTTKFLLVIYLIKFIQIHILHFDPRLLGNNTLIRAEIGEKKKN